MGQTVKAMASSMRGSAVKNRPEIFTEMSDYVDVFNQKINLLNKISQRVYKEKKGWWGRGKKGKTNPGVWIDYVSPAKS